MEIYKIEQTLKSKKIFYIYVIVHKKNYYLLFTFDAIIFIRKIVAMFSCRFYINNGSINVVMVWQMHISVCTFTKHIVYEHIFMVLNYCESSKASQV